MQFGGAVSEAQLAWLRSNLHEAAQQGQRVLVLSHLPLHPATVQPACLMWNFQEVLDVLHAAEEGTVAATIAGHAHQVRCLQTQTRGGWLGGPSCSGCPEIQIGSYAQLQHHSR